MTVELDEKALAKAAQAVGVDMWRVPANPATIARAAITAYLAAAAPAVGVSELNEAIEKVRHAARVAGATGYDWAISAERSACQDLFDLLTAHPEPGTHDDAGVTEGGAP